MARVERRQRSALPPQQVTVDMVIPVYNEEAALPRQHRHPHDLSGHLFPVPLDDRHRR